GAEPKVRLELIRAAGERGATTASPVLVKMARDANPEVRRESVRALRDTASANDIPEMVALVVTPVQAGDRAEAATTLGAVLRRRCWRFAACCNWSDCRLRRGRRANR